MKELTLFRGHQVRIILDNEGNAYFHAQDVGEVLEIEDVKSTIRNYSEKHKVLITNSKVQDMHFRNFDENLHNRGENFLTEAGVYKLSFRSPKQEAEEFTDWVTSEVLPSIRKDGAYITNKANPEALRTKADELERLDTINKSLELVSPLLDAVGIDSNIKLLVTKTLFAKAGINIPIEIEAEERYYDTKQIGYILGIYSKAGKPAFGAVGEIIKQLDIPENEKKAVWESNGAWQGTVIKYTRSVIDKVEQWIKDNGKPIDIPSKNKTFHVVYKELEGGTILC